MGLLLESAALESDVAEAFHAAGVKLGRSCGQLAWQLGRQLGRS